jgi:hypothetical protein
MKGCRDRARFNASILSADAARPPKAISREDSGSVSALYG